MGLLRLGTPHRPQLIQLLRNMLQVNHLASQGRPCINLPYRLQSPSKQKSSLSGFPHLVPRGGSNPGTVTLTHPLELLLGRPCVSRTYEGAHCCWRHKPYWLANDEGSWAERRRRPAVHPDARRVTSLPLVEKGKYSSAFDTQILLAYHEKATLSHEPK